MDASIFALNSEIEMKHWWFVARRRIVAGLVRQLLPSASKPTIVDVGCGTGGNLSVLADDYRCIGIDPSLDAIQFARQRFPKIDFVAGLAPENLSENALQADAFMLNDVLEHVPDDFELLSSLLEISKPGTLFFLTVPADMRLWSPHDVSHGHYRRYSRERFERIWEGLPVTCLLSSHFNTRLHPVVRLVRSLNRLRNASSGDSGTDLKVPAGGINAMLTSIFAGEFNRLSTCLSRPERRPYRQGVSLIAVVRREAGVIRKRERPVELADNPILKAA